MITSELKNTEARHHAAHVITSARRFRRRVFVTNAYARSNRNILSEALDDLCRLQTDAWRVEGFDETNREATHLTSKLYERLTGSRELVG